MTYFKEKRCFVGNSLFISWTASCKFTHLWKPHFLPIVQVLLKSAFLLSAWMSNSCSSDNLMSCCRWKELRWGACLHFEAVCVNELEKKGREGRGPRFQLVLHSSLTKLQGEYYLLFWMLVSLFHEAWHPLLHNLWGMREEMSDKIYVHNSSRYKSV